MSIHYLVRTVVDRFTRPGLSAVLVAVGLLVAGCAPFNSALAGSPTVTVEQAEGEALAPPAVTEASGSVVAAQPSPASPAPGTLAPSAGDQSTAAPTAEPAPPEQEPPASQPPGEAGQALEPPPASPKEPSGPVEDLIAFSRGQDGIFLMNRDGSEQRKLIDGLDPAWSADHRRIAFANGGSGIYVVNADGSNLRQVTTHGRSPNWSPDGSRLVFESFTDRGVVVSVVNVDGTGEQRLTDFPAHLPAWSPDGSLIAFSRSPSDTGASGADVAGIYVIRPDGSQMTRLTTRYDGSPDWSPDGTRIVFGRQYDAGGSGIYLIGRDGRNEVRLTDGQAILVGPKWAPDGTRIIVTRSSEPPGVYIIAIMNADGSDLHDLTTGPMDTVHDW